MRSPGYVLGRFDAVRHDEPLEGEEVPPIDAKLDVVVRGEHDLTYGDEATSLGHAPVAHRQMGDAALVGMDDQGDQRAQRAIGPDDLRSDAKADG